jgi:LacI family transcriptional regulator
VAQEKDYHILVYNTHEHYQKEESIIGHLGNGRVDGVIMSLTSETGRYDHLNDLIQSGVPIVFFDRIAHEIETAKVTTDDFASSFNGTEHLIRQGCRDIAFLSLSDSLSIDNKRKQGYLEALNKYDLNMSSSRIIRCEGDETKNLSTIIELLNSEKRPDAIFASVEKLALSTYNAAREIGIRIPDQLKVICFSNLRTAPLLNPSLTTITQPAFQMGAQAATVLFKYLEKKRPVIQNENIIMKSELIPRESTRRTT